MSRDLDTGTATKVEQSVVRPCTFVEIIFDSGPLRLHTGLGDFQIDGNTFTGAGDMGAVSEIVESVDNTPYRLELTLSGLTPGLIGVALTEDYFGRPVKIWVAFFNDAMQLEDVPREHYRGFVDKMGFVLGKTNEIRVECEDELAIGQRASKIRYSDEDQQDLYPGSLGFQYVDQAEQASFQWGGESVRRGAPRGNSTPWVPSTPTGPGLLD